MNVWTIAGSDCGGGAGIQADLKTFHALGAHGCTVLAALTAQNTRTVTRIEFPSPAMVEAQIDALAADLPPKAIKTGMLGNPEIIEVVARALTSLSCFTVCDPVLVSTSGRSLAEENTKAALIDKLLPVTDLLTPNLPEAESLSGAEIRGPTDMEAAAEQLLKLGVKSVLIKGGHGDNPFSQDYWTDGRRRFWLTGQRIDTPPTHGSGCTLSAAIAAFLALGYDLDNALVAGKAYVTQGIRHARAPGGGARPIFQGSLPGAAEDMPWLTTTAQAGVNRPSFPSCGLEPLGFYPIVDRVAWLERLLPLGVRTVQLRIKDLEGEPLEEEIRASVRLAEQHDARLFINDYWQLALKHKAYGVHLGQEDMDGADFQALAEAGIRLGISTHDDYEAARARALRPSYVALGPIYETTTKVMRFGPQGLDRLKRWRNRFREPLVAIGGINLERAPGVLAAGADSIAVITAITNAANPELETKTWLDLFARRLPQGLRSR